MSYSAKFALFSSLFIATACGQAPMDLEIGSTPQYSAALEIQPGTVDLIVEEITLNKLTAKPNERIAVSSKVSNQGEFSAGASSLKYYLSVDPTFDGADKYLNYDKVGPLESLQSSAETANLRIPKNWQGGDFYILFVADAKEQVQEGDETNNTVAVAITVTSETQPEPAPQPEPQPSPNSDGVDLVIENATLASGSAQPNERVAASCIVANRGTETAGASRIKYYLSTDAVFNTGDKYLNYDKVSALEAGSTGAESANLRIPKTATAGAYFILFVADINGEVAEANEANNVVSLPFVVGSDTEVAPQPQPEPQPTGDQPDLIVQNVFLSATRAEAGEKIAIECDVKNTGHSGAPKSRLKYYLSTDENYNSGDKYLNYDRVAALDVNKKGSEEANLRIKSNVADGDYFILAVADASNEVTEEDETNNVVAIAFTVGAPEPEVAPEPLPDFGPLTIPEQANQVSAFFSPNGGVREEILRNLDNTKQSIDIAMYSYSDLGLWNRVGELAENGITVRLLINEGIFRPSVTDCGKCDTLEDKGVDIRWVRQTLHHKFAIIDGPGMVELSPQELQESVLLTGSGNWSSSSSTRYDEDFLVFVGDALRINDFQSEFNYLWDNSLPWGKDFEFLSNTITQPEDTGVFFTSDNFTVYAGNDNEWRFRSNLEENEGPLGENIIRAIQGAQTSIKIATAHFRRPDIYRAVVDAYYRGVKIQLVTDQAEYSGKKTFACPDPDNQHLDECLGRLDGVEVKYKFYAPTWKYRTAKQMHAKYLIVDDALVLTGSYNWSYTAESLNFENLVVLTGPIVESYIANFDKVFNYGDDYYDKLIRRIGYSRGWGPCSFDPVSMTGEQVRHFRGRYQWDACRQ